MFCSSAMHLSCSMAPSTSVGFSFCKSYPESYNTGNISSALRTIKTVRINYLQRLTNAFDVLRTGLGEKKQNGIQHKSSHINGTSGILQTQRESQISRYLTHWWLRHTSGLFNCTNSSARNNVVPRTRRWSFCMNGTCSVFWNSIFNTNKLRNVLLGPRSKLSSSRQRRAPV